MSGRGTLVLVLVLVFCEFTRGQHQLVQTECHSGNQRHCFRLYRAADDEITWQNAQASCQSEGRRLAIVPDTITQGIMSRFQSVSGGTNHAWIAGTRNDDKWRLINGTEVDDYQAWIEETENAESDRKYCGMLSLEGTTPVYKASRCTIAGSRRALCEYLIPQDAGCHGSYEIRGAHTICFNVTRNAFRSWNDAKVYCQTVGYGDAGLVHKYFTSPKLRNDIWMKHRARRELWVGLARNDWIWSKGFGQVEQMSYLGFRRGEGNGAGEDCIHLELDVNGAWSDKNCRFSSKYFVCEDDIERFTVVVTSPTTSTTTTTTTKPSTRTKTTTTTTPNTTSTTTTTTTPTTATTTTTSKAVPVTTTPTTTTTSETSGSKSPFSFEDMFNGDYWPRGFYAYFIADTDILTYRDTQGDVVWYDASRSSAGVVAENNILAKFNSWTYFLSNDQQYILMANETEKVWRDSFSARYTIYDIASGVSLDFPNLDSLKGKRLQYAKWSNEGTKLAFVYKNNLYYQENPRSRPVQVTEDGLDKFIFNGIPDWMFEEDVLWSRIALYWSKNGDRLCFAKFNLTGTPLSKIPVYGSTDNLYPNILEIAIPKAGDTRNGQAGPTTRVELFVFDTQQMTSSKLQPPAELAKQDYYYTSVKWISDVTLYVTWTNRPMNRSITTICDAIRMRCISNHDLNEANGWVYIPAPEPIFSAGDTHYFTILPQLIPGAGRWRHLAMVSITESSADPGAVTFLTNGTQEIAEIVGYDPVKQLVYYLSNNGNPSERHLFSVATPRADCADKEPICLTCHTDTDCSYVYASFSATGRYYFLSCLGPGLPTYSLRGALDGKNLVFQNNAYVKSKLETKALPRREFVDVVLPGDPSVKYSAEVWFPPNYRPGNSYRHLHYVYAGPDTQVVTKRFPMYNYPTMWLTYLSSTLNVIITKFDGRGTIGRGDNFRFKVYQNLGVADVEDQISGGRYFKQQTYINASVNAAVLGYSYGGLMSSLSMAEDTDVFRCGLAISPVTSKRFYDRAFSERYLGYANESQLAYDGTDVMLRAAKFKGNKFFTAHGTKDDNVQLINSAKLNEALTDNGIPFTQQIYTDGDHNLGTYKITRHLYTAMTDFLLNACWESDC